jgi:hypothetical protein
MSKAAQTHPGKPLAINSCFFFLQSGETGGANKLFLFCSSSSRNAPRGVRDLILGTQRRSTAAHAPGPHMLAATRTPPHQLSPALGATLSQGKHMPSGRLACSCDPAGAVRGQALAKGCWGQSTPNLRERGARMSAAQCQGWSWIHPPPAPPQESPAPSAPPCHRSCGPSVGPGWACCRLPRPPRCWSRLAGAACRARTGAPWTAGPWGARPPWRAALGTRAAAYSRSSPPHSARGPALAGGGSLRPMLLLPARLSFPERYTTAPWAKPRQTPAPPTLRPASSATPPTALSPAPAEPLPAGREGGTQGGAELEGGGGPPRPPPGRKCAHWQLRWGLRKHQCELGSSSHTAHAERNKNVERVLVS